MQDGQIELNRKKFKTETEKGRYALDGYVYNERMILLGMEEKVWISLMVFIYFVKDIIRV